MLFGTYLVKTSYVCSYPFCNKEKIILSLHLYISNLDTMSRKSSNKSDVVVIDFNKIQKEIEEKKIKLRNRRNQIESTRKFLLDEAKKIGLNNIDLEIKWNDNNITSTNLQELEQNFRKLSERVANSIKQQKEIENLLQIKEKNPSSQPNPPKKQPSQNNSTSTFDVKEKPRDFDYDEKVNLENQLNLEKEFIRNGLLNFAMKYIHVDNQDDEKKVQQIAKNIKEIQTNKPTEKTWENLRRKIIRPIQFISGENKCHQCSAKDRAINEFISKMVNGYPKEMDNIQAMSALNQLNQYANNVVADFQTNPGFTTFTKKEVLDFYNKYYYPFHYPSH